MAGGGQGSKAVVAALAANVGIAVSKFIGFAVTGSASMLAEAIHSLADSGNQCLLLLGGKRARRAADEEHPFGYGRERYFWAFIVAMVLFSIGGAFAIFEGIEKIQHPHELDRPAVGVAILVVAIVLEGLSFRTAVQEGNKLRSGAGWWTFIRRSKNPELPVVLLEDFGALIGLGLALAGLTMAVVTDDAVWDGYGTLGIGLLLTAIAAVLAVEMKSLLLGESAAPSVVTRIRGAIEDEATVRHLIHLRTQHLGPEELLVGAKVAFDVELSVPELAEAIDQLEASVRSAVPAVGILYIEPDVLRAGGPSTDEPDASEP